MHRKQGKSNWRKKTKKLQKKIQSNASSYTSRQVKSFQYLVVIFLNKKFHYFSGFKELSESSHPLTVISLRSSAGADDSIEQTKCSLRLSKRRKIEHEELSIAKCDEKILKTFLIKRNFVRARETTCKTMSHWMPRIELTQLSSIEIMRLSNDWRFLKSLKINDTMEFRCDILAQHKTPHSNHPKFLVRWLPPGIINDCWIDKMNLPHDRIMKINIQNMSWQQKLLIRDKLLNSTWSDKKKSVLKAQS